jgi:hypothetical protein
VIPQVISAVLQQYTSAQSETVPAATAALLQEYTERVRRTWSLATATSVLTSLLAVGVLPDWPLCYQVLQGTITSTLHIKDTDSSSSSTSSSSDSGDSGKLCSAVYTCVRQREQLRSTIVRLTELH